MSDQLQPAPAPHAATISPARRVIGGLLLIIGILMTVASGLCTGVLMVAFAFDSNTGPELSGDGLFLIPLMFGGPFIVAGGLLWWGGKALRGKQPPAPPPPWAQPPAPPGS